MHNALAVTEVQSLASVVSQMGAVRLKDDFAYTLSNSNI